MSQGNSAGLPSTTLMFTSGTENNDILFVNASALLTSKDYAEA